MNAQNVEKFFEELNISSSRKRISEELFIKLRDAILSGSLPSGFVFPNENELCKKLDIGRSTLREAYASLEAMNLITRTKSGTYINEETDTRNLMNFDRIAHYTDPANLLEYRIILEAGIAETAAKRATPADVKALTEIVELMEENKHSTEKLAVYDFMFHQMLAKITGNELLVIALSSVREIFEKFAFEVFNKNPYNQSFEDHINIINAVASGNAKEASAYMSIHLSHIKATINPETARKDNIDNK